MLLVSIQLQGFKSFPDKTTLKFGKGITGIVGPNGSGKSNITDAVRWVLGEQSTKNLRGQSMEHVIFGGNATRRPHGFCEVTLNIDNTDRSLNFEDDFVSVTRRFYRSHESEYLINNVSVRLKDINELFMDTGLGRDGYSMVGQGKIDSIISTKSNERRDIFEEASGISKYRYRKTETERKLAAADENLIRLKDIIKELEERVGPLKEQSEKAEKFLDLVDKKKELEIGLWLYSLANFKQALRVQEEKISTCQAQYKDIEDSLEEFDDITEKNSTLFSQITIKIDEKHQAISRYNEQIAVLGGNISVIENDMLHNNSTIQRLEAEIENLKGSENDALAEVLRNRSLADEKHAKIEEIKTQIINFENSLTNLLSESESFSRQIEELSQQINTISAKTADLRVTKLSGENTVAEIDSRIAVIEASIEEKQCEKLSLEGELGETNQMLSKIEENIKDCENSLKGYELRFNSRKEKVEQLKKELDEAHLDIEAKKRRIQILEELEKNMEGFAYSVKSVMQDSETGILRGVHGTVASLINVDKEYSVAIETALGQSLQNIVVDSDADAKRAINSLKQANAGRATFLPISSINVRPFTESGYEDMFGFVGIASDLVKTDSKYSEIIKYLLGAVVVTEDIDTAVSIAKKFNYHFKIVSLDGQVINAGGSLTGGSLVKNAGILSRKEDIKKINNDIEKLIKKQDELSKNYTKASDDLATIEADIVSAKDAITTSNEDKIRTLSETKRIEEICNSVVASINQYNSDIEASKIKKNELLSSSQKAAEELLVFEEQKQKIQSQIDEITGGRDSISTNREEITQKITELKLAEIETAKDYENLLSTALSIETAINNRDERINQVNAEIEAVKGVNFAKNSDIESINKTIDELKTQITQNESEILSLTSQRSNIEQQGTQLRINEREKTLEREKISGELVRLTERRENMTAEYDNIIKQMYDEYNLTRSEAEQMGLTVEKPSDAKRELGSIKSSIRGLGNVNVSAIEEYKDVSERYNFMSEQIADIENSRAQLTKLINQLTSQMQEMFITGFERINQAFSKTFTELFGGGTATLFLTEPDNILESGIDINAKLPGKNVPSLDGLSGGEKALVALSIYFAIMAVNPPPFCFLDEVDTALDDVNVERFAQYMKRPDFSTQFICVTHRRGTMEASDMLYGVTMQEKGVTKLLELNINEIEKTLLEGDN